jgi:hypothetical protein
MASSRFANRRRLSNSPLRSRGKYNPAGLSPLATSGSPLDRAQTNVWIRYFYYLFIFFIFVSGKLPYRAVYA